MSDVTSLPLRPVAPVTHASLLQFPEDPVSCMRRLHQQHGDLAILEQDDRRLAFVFSPELNRQVLTNSNSFHSQFFAVRGSRQSAQRRVTAGLLSQNGHEHRESRRLLKDVFSRRVLPDYHPTICRLTHELMHDWQPGQVRDLNAEMVQFMRCMTSALLFGLEDPLFVSLLGQQIDQWVHRNHDVGMGALVSAPQFNQKYDELLRMAEELEGSIHLMLARHQRNSAAGANTLTLMQQAQIPQQQLTGHATLLFAAAHLTTAHTFSWTLFLLTQHPRVMERLRHELNQQMTTETPTIEELEQLPYLDWVIRESMRILPASAYSQRVAAEPVQLGTVRLSPGTPVVFSQYMTHHRADLYKEPDLFIPERWATISPSPYEYLPFGAGPRMCIGAPLAMAELRTALAMILKRFHFQMTAGATVDGRVISTMLGPTCSIPAELLSTDELPEVRPVGGSIHRLIQLPDAFSGTVRRAA